MSATLSPGGTAPVRVMLCDDSATVRSALARLLEADPAIRVVARAANGQEAVTMLAGLPAAQRPQVVLLDLEMPVMDGMTALPLLLRQSPRPAVIVASALTQRGAATAMAALRAGAADYIPKPGAAGGGLNDPAFRAEILAKVKGWARMGATAIGPAAASPRPAMAAVPRPVRPPPQLPMRGLRAIGIGCSTGGPQALATLVQGLTRPLPVPVLVVQHMPAGFTAMLADHLDRLGRLPCAEARDGEALRPGRLYLAPGNRHLLVEAAGTGMVARLSDAPPENFCRPAVDPMLRSLAACCGGHVLAVILTGMGQDGMLGCRAVAQAGGTVLAQDEASSVVWGMPGAVAKAGLAQALLPPAALAEQVLAAAGFPAGAMA
ncbi:chemotaxis-specific protein-glutamate methyltransferase CheB [Roseicella aquatilis]|nr:chemotaxis-specific protein-glutamate methyltransferase CheB [Roseicella aquatilis]